MKIRSGARSAHTESNTLTIIIKNHYYGQQLFFVMPAVQQYNLINVLYCFSLTNCPVCSLIVSLDCPFSLFDTK